MATSDPVNRQKSSSHPLKPGQFYQGVVTAVDASGRVTVSVKTLGASYGPIMPIGATALKLGVNDTVLCTFTDEFFNDLIVFGSSRIKLDVFASKSLFEALVTRVNSLEARIEALEG
jgi:hypothetical protein